MFHPTRGGVRGGKDQFTWESVKTDKDRECYLGHSLKAPVGRWQNGKDILWYSKDNENNKIEDSNKSDEFIKIKESEERALMAALGYKNYEPKKISQKSDSENDNDKERKLNSKSKKHKIDSKSSKKDKKNNEELDSILLKLLEKHDFDEIYKALEYENDSSDNESTSDSTETENENEKDKKRSKHHHHHKSHKSKKKKKKSKH